jgi:peptidoglycan/xylan/chitin deacetylase (PgdA/CDA1 family)
MPLHAYFQAAGYVGGFALLAWAASWLGGAWALGALLGLGIYACHLFLPGLGLAPWRGRRGGKRIALTFDDGPNGADTDAVLEALARHGARATFFMVGKSAAAEPERVRRIAAAGHEIGNHTMNHAILAWRSPGAVAREIAAAQAAIVAAGAPAPRWFRAPHGFKSPFLPRALSANGLRLVAWTRGVWDTDRPGAPAIVARTIGERGERLSDGEILLLHDGEAGLDRSQTAAALDGILGACAARDLRPVTLTELLGAP